MRPRGWIEREAPPRGTVLDLCSHHNQVEVTIDDLCERIPDTCRRIAARSSPPDLAKEPKTIQHETSRPEDALDVDDAPRVTWGAYLRAAHSTRLEDAAESTKELTVLCLALAERVLALEAALASATQMLQTDAMPREEDAAVPSPRVREIQVRALEIVAASTPSVLSALADRITARKERREKKCGREERKANQET